MTTMIKSVLIIEDNENMLSMMRDLLSRADYRVLSAVDGLQGMRAFHAGHPDLVITDIIMPDREGLEVIMELVKQNPRPRIIAISGGGMAEADTYLLMAKQFGADRVLAKPFRPKELLEIVGELLP